MKYYFLVSDLTLFFSSLCWWPLVYSIELGVNFGAVSPSQIFLIILNVSIRSCHLLQRLKRRMDRFRYLRWSCSFVTFFALFQCLQFAWGDQTVDAYSRWLLTNDLYKPTNVSLSIYLKFVLPYLLFREYDHQTYVFHLFAPLDLSFYFLYQVYNRRHSC